MAMKFIHAADIHLDSPLNGLSAYPDAPAAQLRSLRPPHLPVAIWIWAVASSRRAWSGLNR